MFRLIVVVLIFWLVGYGFYVHNGHHLFPDDPPRVQHVAHVVSPVKLTHIPRLREG